MCRTQHTIETTISLTIIDEGYYKEILSFYTPNRKINKFFLFTLKIHQVWCMRLTVFEIVE